MKKKFGLFCLLFALTFVFSFNVSTVFAQEKIYLGGMPAGFVVSMRGVEVVGFSDVVTEKGTVSPAKDAGVEIGDVILKIGNTEVNCINDVECAIKDCSNNVLFVKRGNLEIIKSINIAKDIVGKNRLGVFIKDSVSGVGTVTFIKGERFASLGHPIMDEKGEIVHITGGSAYSCSIVGCVRGEKGHAGQLKGVFLRNEPIFKIDKNVSTGVFGSVVKFDKKNLTEIEVGKAVPGDAQIVSTVCGQTKKYNISIVKVDEANKVKNFVIKVDDKELLESTGGIVQGMSGSPILQNNKLVGAVTHVFLNDPTRGFGIDICNMLDN